MLHDLRLGLRGIRRAPAFALTAILTLAVGIGLSTAVFTVADALLLRQLPVRDQDRLVLLWGETRDGRFPHYPLGLAEARELARRSRTLERAAFLGYEGAAAQVIRDGGQTSRLSRTVVSGDFFEVLGARPVLGRALAPEDDVRGAAPVVVLSHASWQQRFGSDPAILGRQIVLHRNGVAHTIVGVMPQGLDYPRGTDFWAAVVPSTPEGEMPARGFDVIGRLAPGATPAGAREEMSGFLRRADAPAWRRDLQGVVHILPRLVLGDTRPALIAFAAAAVLLLVITCINVANLLLVRGLARAREVAVRSALGASRTRVVVQLLTENVLLAIAGGVSGVAVAAAAVRAFVAFAPAAVPRLDEIRIDATALGGAIAITGVAMLLFSLAPAVMTSRIELQQMLRPLARQTTGRRSRLATELLVGGQVALAVLVLSAAGLITKSLVELERAELSFDASHLLIGELALRFDRYDSVTKQHTLLEELVPRLNAVPGVRGVSPVVAVPFSGSHGWDGRPAAEGQAPADAATNPMLNMEVVGTSYFETLGIRLVGGRGFTEADRQGAPPIIVISESAARHYWPGGDPIGRRLMMGPNRPLTVVGVVPETRYRDLRDARPSIYFPLRQSFFPFAPMALVIRTTGPPGDAVPSIRRVIEEMPGVVLANAAPFTTFLRGPLAQPRLNALLLAMFAAAAVVLAAVGLFGVMTTMVRQRTRELGVRMALGATAHDLRGMVMRRGLSIAAAGTAVGLLGAVLANRLLAAMLYEVSPTDPVTLGIVALALLSVAALASHIPARASTRIDPMTALRAEG